MAPRHTISTAIAAALLVLPLAACSSSGNKGSNTSSATGGGSSSGATSSGVAEARAFIEPLLANPTALGITQALSKRPDSGKLIISVNDSSGGTITKLKGLEAAAKALGWRYKSVPVQSTANGPATAFALAVAQNPDGITLGGFPPESVATSLADACKKNIPVVWDSTPIADDVLAKYPCIISATLTSAAQVSAWGKRLAAQVIAQSNGHAHVVMFNIPSYPILVIEADAFKQWLNTWCPPPACTVTVKNVDVSALGTPTIGNGVVNYYRSHTDTNFMYAAFGDMADGVPSILASAGLTKKVTIIGANPTQGELEALKKGDAGAWAASPQPVVGWRLADIFARHFNGDSLAPTLALNADQLLTKANIGGASVDSDGMYIGVADYQAQFKKLWSVS